MNILSEIYERALGDNKKNIIFWEEYLKNLNALDFTAYSESLSVPILVPIGNKILFRGSLKHTNEVTVSLGADYFAKCSTKQAEILRQHRIKDAQSKLEIYYKEKEYLKNQISFNRENIYEHDRKDIIEQCSDEEDLAWRAKHRERVRDYKRNNTKRQENANSNIDDEALWMRLEELELQEELENELVNKSLNAENENDVELEYESFILKNELRNNIGSDSQIQKVQVKEVVNLDGNVTNQSSKFDLLQQVVERQRMLETKLIDIKNREKVKTESEDDLLSKLDEIEQLDELEDEIYRIDGILDEEQDEDVNLSETLEDSTSESKPTVTFNLDESNETLEITFKHSNVEPSHVSYNSNKGITKPSDIYDAFNHLFAKESKSILKKSKYQSEVIDLKNVEENKQISHYQNKELEVNRGRTILVKDIIEKSNSDNNAISNDQRPPSLFKTRRQQQRN